MAVNQINDLLITSFIDLEAYDRSTGMLDFRLEELQDITVRANEEKTKLKGRNGRTIGIKKKEKSVSGEGKSGTVCAGLMKAQTGGQINAGTQIIRKSEVGKADEGVVITKAQAVGTPGAEIGTIKVLGEGGVVTAEYDQAAAADATHFAYDPAEKTITLPVSGGASVIADGTQIVYAYSRNVSGTRINDPSDSFSGTREIWIHCLGTDSCDREYFAAIYIPRADFSGDFSLGLGGDQTVHNFSFEALADTCSGASGADLFSLIVYTDEEE